MACVNCGDPEPITENSGDDWLGCIPWDGSEASLPLGGFIIGAAGIRIQDFIKSGKGLLLKVDEDLYKELIKTFGPKSLMIRSAVGELLTREEWKARYKTDGLKLWAIMQSGRDVRASRIVSRPPLRLRR